MTLIFCSEEFGEVNITDLPISTPPKEIKKFFESIKKTLGLPNLKLNYISKETAKKYNPFLKVIGSIGWGSAEQQLICVVESEGGFTKDDPISTTKSVMIHEAVHALDYYHGVDFDEKNIFYHKKLNCQKLC